ncbi:MAG: roadblock/LC7 domain-containing protein [Promethearchaeota archaeon]
MKTVPDQIRNNNLTKILDDIRLKYGQLSQNSTLLGLVITDSDAKVLATNTFFDTDINYWDVGAIGAALYGIGKQARDFFSASDLKRATLIFDDKKFFVHSIGYVDVQPFPKEIVLIVIGKNKINIGLIVMLMQRAAPKIKESIKQDIDMNKAMKMTEEEFIKHINQMKRELFVLGGIEDDIE